MNTLDAYIAYNEALAINHPAIRHNPTSASLSRFGVDNIDAILEGKFSNVLTGEVVFRALNPVFRPFTSESDGNLERIEAGFTILKKTTLADVEKLMADTKAVQDIVKDIICRIIEDCRAGESLFGYSINNLNEANFNYDIQPFAGNGEFIAIIVSYQFKTLFVESLSQHVSETGWLDIP